MIYSKRVVVITAAILIIFSVTVTPAYAWSFKDIFHSSSADIDYKKQLDKIDEQIWELSNDTKLMEFINRNMHDQQYLRTICPYEIAPSTPHTNI